MADDDQFSEENLWSRVLPDWEIWACARSVEMHKGYLGSSYLQERLASMREAGDDAGLKTWERIAFAYSALTAGDGRPN